MSLDVLEILAKVLYGLIPLWLALCFHEYAHGWVAKKRGDPTAEQMGRLTMNPMAHLDIIGTVALPVVAILSGFPLIGWAKPVPVNPSNLQNPKKDMFWVAFAGPLSNILLALLGFVVYAFFKNVNLGLSAESLSLTFNMLNYFIFINFVLFVLNMIPVHPLDGAKVLERFLPYNINKALLDHQGTLFIVFLVFVFTGLFSYLLSPFIWFQQTVISFL